jgi:hypothetical protein
MWLFLAVATWGARGPAFAPEAAFGRAMHPFEARLRAGADANLMEHIHGG